jgi:hypothetical protein
MYMTDERPCMGHNTPSGGADAGSCGQDRILAVEDDAPSPESARERLPCAKLTLGIDPRRPDSGVGGRLVEGFARQIGGRWSKREGNKGTPCS